MGRADGHGDGACGRAGVPMAAAAAVADRTSEPAASGAGGEASSSPCADDDDDEASCARGGEGDVAQACCTRCSADCCATPMRCPPDPARSPAGTCSSADATPSPRTTCSCLFLNKTRQSVST